MIYVPCRRLDRADWDSFRSFCKIGRKIKEFEGVEEAIVYYTNILQWSSEQSIPQTPGVLIFLASFIGMSLGFRRYRRKDMDF